MRDLVPHFILGSVFALVVLAVTWLFFFAPSMTPDTTVMLTPYPWEGAYVNVWDEVREGPDVRHTQVLGGTKCTLLQRYAKLGYGETAMHFELVACGHVVGYVNIDNLAN